MVLDSEHGEEYEVLEDYKRTHDKILFRHTVCGKTFPMTGNNFLVKGNRCPHCPRSLGEEKIEQWLIENEIMHDVQVTQEGLGNLKFDFLIHLEDSSYALLEYDGRFHFEPFSQKPEHITKFESQKHNDKLKDEYCDSNGIFLLRIPYTKLNNIELILEKTFNDYRNHTL